MCLPPKGPPVRPRTRSLQRTTSFDYIPVKSAYLPPTSEIELFENKNNQFISREEIVDWEYEKACREPIIRDHDNTEYLESIAKEMRKVNIEAMPSFVIESVVYPQDSIYTYVPMTADDLRRQLQYLLHD